MQSREIEMCGNAPSPGSVALLRDLASLSSAFAHMRFGGLKPAEARQASEGGPHAGRGNYPTATRRYGSSEARMKSGMSLRLYEAVIWPATVCALCPMRVR
jgi:hypothetical protein